MFVVGLFAKALEGVNVKELITNIGNSVGSAPAAGGGAAAGGAAPAQEEKKGNYESFSDCLWTSIVRKV